MDFMKRIKLFLMSAIAMLTLVGQQTVSAQSTTTRWKGADVDTLKSTTGFLLYNVGTGKFVMQGGNWGTHGMLLFQDFGAAMKSTTVNGRRIIYSGAQNAQYNNSNCFGVNYPKISSNSNWGDANQAFGLIFEASYNEQKQSPNHNRSWTFTRVETDENADTYTYYLTETINNTSNNTNVTCYVGAVNGIDPNKGESNGLYVNVGNDIVAFTTEDGHQTSDNLNYQWRFVTEKEVEEVLKSESSDVNGGLYANLSYLLNDPYLCRNRNDEFKNWIVTNSGKASTEEANHYRYNWYGTDNYKAVSNGTKGSTTCYNSNNSGNTSSNQTPWNEAIFRKPTFDTKADGQYSFGLFEGIGEVSQTFTAPVTGRYEIEVNGFYQGNEAKLFARGGDQSPEKALKQANGFSKYKTSDTNINPDYDGLLTIGKALVNNENGQYTNTITFQANAGTVITFGVKKTAATKSDVVNSSYYFDTDIAAVKGFNILYLGDKEPFVLDEDRTSDSYMQNANVSNTAMYLHRTFTLNKWNSLVLPINLTSAQVKQVFGENTKLAILRGVGKLSGVSSIDFETVPLPADGNAIEAGKLYIINPTLGPESTITYKNQSNVDVTNDCYNLGRRDLKGSEIKDPQGETGESVIDTVLSVHYQGTYIKLEANNAKAPQAKSYVFSGGKMYHITKPHDIKGFRGWLNDIEKINAKSFSIDGDEGTVTSIDGVVDYTPVQQADNRVFTLGGQMVGRGTESLNSLPAGIYIVGGNKIVVK